MNKSMSLKRIIFLQITPRTGESLPIGVRIVLIAIILSIFLAIIETEKQLVIQYHNTFNYFNVGLGAFFTIEFLLRIWVCGEDPKYSGWKGRFRFLFRPIQIIDLIVLVGFYVTVGANDTFALRLFRLVRILSIAKLGRYTRALNTIGRAIKSRSYELTLGIGLSFLMLLFSSTIMYIFEHEANPENFGSIPRAMWWGVATMSKVGYGGAFPETAIGRLSAGLLSLSAVAAVAVPTSILAGAFVEAFRAEINKNRNEGNGGDD